MFGVRDTAEGGTVRRMRVITVPGVFVIVLARRSP